MQPNIMSKRKASQNPAETPPKRAAPKKRAEDKAFDEWVNRGLHQLYDDVAKEPVPDDLLQLIRTHKSS